MVSATAGYDQHTFALIDVVARSLRLASASNKRQKPTRMPYSCQAQFGTSGTVATPCGAVRYCLATGFSISHSSMFTMVHTASRAPSGSFQGCRRLIGE